jgi:nucleoside-diphosphate-sugar epimerase
LNVNIVNPGIILGPGFWKQGSGVFFTEIKKGFPFYTKGISAYVGVIDVVKIMVLLMQSSNNGERYTLISENVSYEKIITQIAEKFAATKPTLEAKPWLLGIAWRIDWVLSTFFRTKRKLSKYSAQALCSYTLISNDKIKIALQYEFQGIDDVIKKCIDIQQ